NGAFDGGSPNIFTPTGSPATVSASTIASNLNTANVTITTGSTGAEAGNITVSSAITWTSPYTLLLDAASNIIINAGITALNGTLQLRAGALANTITTGASGTINVKNFNLLRGTWSQVSTSLPSFTVSGNFQINSGTMGFANSNAAFIRAANASSVNLGQASNPVELVDIYGLQGAGSTATTLGYYYALNNNINAAATSNWNSGSGFVPITGYASTFEGNDFIVSNLYINRPSTDLVGLFGSSGGTIQNVGVMNADITGQQYVGGLVGSNSGTITDSFSTGTISGLYFTGGLVGYNSNDIATSYSSADVSAQSGGAFTGGLVGYSTNAGSTITDTYATGAVSGFTNAGGLVGFLDASSAVSNSYSTGAVSGNAGSRGGLIGGGSGSVTNSFWDTETSGQSTSFGGTGKTTAEMMSATTFSTPGWSIASTGFTGATPPANTWLILNGQTRPMLRAEWSTNLNTPHQLQLMATALDGAYTQISNIDLNEGMNNAAEIWGTNRSTSSGAGFVPVGTFASNFIGSFDGNGYTINNLVIYQPSQVDDLGLFGATGAATITNAGLINASVTGGWGFSNGPLVGWTGVSGATSISNSYSLNGTVVIQAGNAGGLVGGTDFNLWGSTINDSYASGSVTALFTHGGTVGTGGLVGRNRSTINNSYSFADVTSADYEGGFVGYNEGTITNSYSSGEVVQTSTRPVGGFIGVNTGGITASFWDTDTSNQAVGVGTDFIGGDVTGGCFTGTCTNGGAANLSALATYTGAGWSITSTSGTAKPAGTWFIFEGDTRPILLAEQNTRVNTPHQLQMMGSTLGASYTLGSDIDLSSLTTAADVWGNTEGFVPIANFSGSLDGNNYTISNLYINRPSAPSGVGLFGSTSGSASIQNLYIDNASVSSGNTTRTGILLGYHNATSGYINNITISDSTVTSTATNSRLGGAIGASEVNAGALHNIIASNVDVNASGFSGGYVGGLIGRSLSGTSLFNSYYSGTINLTSSGTWFGGLIGEMHGTVANSFSLPIILNSNPGSSSGGGLVGTLSTGGSISNSYSMGYIQHGNRLGGLVGQLAGGGSISNSFSTLYIAAGNTRGGAIGEMTGGTISNSFWDTETSGLSAGVGSQTGGTITNLTGGCFTGVSCGNGGTANLSSQATYPSGWNFSTVWGIIEGQSYPYLRAFFSDTPRAISGIVSGISSNNTVTLAANGVNVTTNGLTQGTTQTAANGFYYFLQPNDAITDAQVLLAYLTTGGVANAVTLAPASGGSITGLNMAANTVSVGDDNTNTLTNANLSTAKGSLSDTDILFSVTSNNLTLGNATNPNVSLATTATTTYNVDGNITAGGTGSLTFDGAVNLSADSIFTTTSGNIIFNNTLNSLTSTFRSLTLNSSGITRFGGNVGGTTFALLNLTTDSGGTTEINGGNITTRDSQTYNDPVTLGANTQLFSTSGGGEVRFNNTLSGAFSLTTNNSVAYYFNNTVSGLTSFTAADTGGFTAFSANVTTSGAQDYNNQVLFSGDATLTGTDISFSNGISTLGCSTCDLTVNASGTTLFEGVVNGLASLTTDSNGTTKVYATGITTSGNQTYNDPVEVGINTAFTSTAGNLHFADTIDIDPAAPQGYSLTFNASNGTLTFDGKIGSAPTRTPTLLTATANTIYINGGTDISLNPTIDTLGTQTYTGATVLGADTVLYSLTGDVSFISDATHTSTIDSDNALTPRALTVYFGNDNYFSADIGASVPLASLTSTPLAVTFSIHFQDTLNPANVINVTTVGDQTYGDDVHLD
ncbi:beta strand repeat-containing protein, partial [Aquicella lusitana]